MTDQQAFASEVAASEGLAGVFGESEPVVLIGRGGSGTRLLSELARPLGVFLGNDLNVSSDSVEWVEDVYELAVEHTMVGVVADSARDTYWRERLRQRAATVLARAGRTPGTLWGWKLPETMLILPQVLRSFPRCRVVHLIRHPQTSALRRTHITSRMDNPVGRAVLTVACSRYGLYPQSAAQLQPYVHNALSWRYQIEQVLLALDSHDPARVLILRYEDVCASPMVSQTRLSAFLGLPSGLATSAHIIDPDRVGLLPADVTRAQHVWEICGPLAERLGYHPS